MSNEFQPIIDAVKEAMSKCASLAREIYPTTSSPVIDDALKAWGLELTEKLAALPAERQAAGVLIAFETFLYTMVSTHQQVLTRSSMFPQRRNRFRAITEVAGEGE